MAEDGILADVAARPVWTTVAETLREPDEASTVGNGAFEAVSCEDSTHDDAERVQAV